MSKIRQTRTVIKTHEVIRVHSGSIDLRGRCPLCGHESGPLALPPEVAPSERPTAETPAATENAVAKKN